MSSLTGNNFQTGQNLENASPVSNDLNDITQRITGITYDGVNDTTTISNNLVITDGKNLFINNYNVDARIDQLDADLNVVENSIIDIQNVNDTQNVDIDLLQLDMDTAQSDIIGINSKITGISYDSPTDTTTIDNNVVISSGKTLTLNGSNVNTRITDLETKTNGQTYISGTDTTQFDNNVIIPVGKTFTLNGQNVNTRIDNLETNMNGITYDSVIDSNNITNTSINLNGIINLNGYINAVSNSINNVSNLYINAGGAVYVGGSPINTSALLSLNNTWTGTNDFTDNDCRVALQLVNTSSSLAASTDFVQQQFDYFTSHSQIYTGASATQNFTNSNITVPTQSNADNSQKASNSVYVNNKFTQFRTDNQTINGVITFSVPPVSTQSLSLLENTTRIPNATWIYMNMGGQTSIGIYTEFADFYNFGSPLTTIYLDNSTFTMDGRSYVVNAKPMGLHPNSNIQNAGTVAGHQGVIQLLAKGNTLGNNWVSLNWNGSGTYSIHPFNLAMFECCLCNVSSNIFNTNFIIWAGMSGDSTPNNFFGWKYDSGSWRAVYVESGVETFITGSAYPSFVNPLIGRYMRLNVIFRVSGNTMTVIWNYLNTWTGESASYSQAGINNSSLPMMGPFTYVFTPTYASNIDVNINLDTWITKYYCNRG